MRILSAIGYWIVAALLLVVGDVLFRKNREDAEEGKPWDFGDPCCPGYRPDLTREQREQAAADWRKRMEAIRCGR